jgi:Sec-independent protein translocase protein TatA
MNILGIGGPELIIILLLMLIVAGPKRMIQWAYIMGTYVAKFRRMWAETVDVLQHEFDEAGVGVQIPKDLPTRGSIRSQAAKMMSTVTDPVKETMGQLDAEVKQIGTATSAAAQSVKTTARTSNGHAASRASSAARSPASHMSDGFGSWSSHETRPDFGSWTGNGQDGEEK